MSYHFAQIPIKYANDIFDDTLVNGFCFILLLRKSNNLLVCLSEWSYKLIMDHKVLRDSMLKLIVLLQIFC